MACIVEFVAPLYKESMEIISFLKPRVSSLLISCAFALIIMPLLNAQSWVQLPLADAASSIAPTCSLADTSCVPTFYGSQRSWMLRATSDWYQHRDFWCGIANIHAIQVYDWLAYNGSKPLWDDAQEAVYARLNDTHTPGVVSPWGYGGGYVKADISRDTGTDPRALAFGLWYETPPSYKKGTDSDKTYQFHNWIYHTNSTTATYDFSSDFGQNPPSHNDPMSVTVDRGGHSFVVDGVWAASDPSLANTTITAIDTWDPWLNRSNQPRINGIQYNQFQNQVWSLYDWTTNPRLWGEPYTPNYGNDPDPTRPPLISSYYVPPFPHSALHHWIGSYITIEQDSINSVNFNMALDQNGHLVHHNAS